MKHYSRSDSDLRKFLATKEKYRSLTYRIGLLEDSMEKATDEKSIDKLNDRYERLGDLLMNVENALCDMEGDFVTEETTLKGLNKATSSGNYQVTIPLRNIESNLKDFRDNEGLQINADFQRGHVWSRVQQVKFIEFIINNPGKRQIIYFNSSDWGVKDMVLVDGLQRLTALRMFLAGDIPAYGKYIFEYEDADKWIRRTKIEFNVNNLKTRDEVLKWYIEMNSGGSPHTDEEIDRVIGLMKNESNY